MLKQLWILNQQPGNKSCLVRAYLPSLDDTEFLLHFKIENPDHRYEILRRSGLPFKKIDRTQLYKTLVYYLHHFDVLKKEIQDNLPLLRLYLSQPMNGVFFLECVACSLLMLKLRNDSETRKIFNELIKLLLKTISSDLTFTHSIDQSQLFDLLIFELENDDFERLLATITQAISTKRPNPHINKVVFKRANAAQKLEIELKLHDAIDGILQNLSHENIEHLFELFNNLNSVMSDLTRNQADKFIEKLFKIIDHNNQSFPWSKTTINFLNQVAPFLSEPEQVFKTFINYSKKDYFCIWNDVYCIKPLVDRISAEALQLFFKAHLDTLRVDLVNPGLRTETFFMAYFLPRLSTESISELLNVLISHYQPNWEIKYTIAKIIESPYLIDLTTSQQTFFYSSHFFMKENIFILHRILEHTPRLMNPSSLKMQHLICDFLEQYIDKRDLDFTGPIPHQTYHITHKIFNLLSHHISYFKKLSPRHIQRLYCFSKENQTPARKILLLCLVPYLDDEQHSSMPKEIRPLVAQILARPTQENFVKIVIDNFVKDHEIDEGLKYTLALFPTAYSAISKHSLSIYLKELMLFHKQDVSPHLKCIQEEYTKHDHSSYHMVINILSTHLEPELLEESLKWLETAKNVPHIKELDRKVLEIVTLGHLEERKLKLEAETESVNYSVRMQ